MSTITTIVRGTAKDFEAFQKLALRAGEFVATNAPGTLTYECYLDDETSRFVWHEIYEDRSAFLDHVEKLMATGIPQEVDQIVEWEGITALGDVDDEATFQILEDLGAEVFRPHLSVMR